MATLGSPVRVHGARLAGNIIGVIASALFAAVLWILVVTFDKSPTGVVVTALGFSVLSVILMISLWRDARLLVTAYEHGVGWQHGSKTRSLHFDDIADAREVRSTVVIRTHAGDLVAVPSNVNARDELLAHLGLGDPKVPTAKARMRSRQ